MRPASSLWRLINLTGLCCRSAAGDASARRCVDAVIEAMARAILS
jgi:predicted NBD/HSP70 family sugar kinase